jgi:hypothetical protein
MDKLEISDYILMRSGYESICTNHAVAIVYAGTMDLVRQGLRNVFQSTTVSIKIFRRVSLESTGVTRSNGGGIWKRYSVLV